MAFKRHFKFSLTADRLETLEANEQAPRSHSVQQCYALPLSNAKKTCLVLLKISLSQRSPLPLTDAPSKPSEACVASRASRRAPGSRLLLL